MKKNIVFIFGIFVYILFAIFSEDYFYPDEHFQIIEFASYKLGITPKEHLSWEFLYKMRPTIQVWFVFLLFKTLISLGIENPFYLAMILRFIIGIASFFTFYKLYYFFKNKYNINTNTFFYSSICFIIFPFFGVRFSSETVSMLILIWLILLYFSSIQFKYLIIGFLLGILFFVKFQMAILVLPIFLLLSYLHEKEIKWIVLGGFLALILNIGIDSIYYQQIEFSFYNYFYQNIILKKSEVFGKEPIYYYLKTLFIVFVPVISIVWVYVFRESFKYNLLKIFVLLFIFFVFVNSFIAHKEFRFLVPILFVLPFLYITIYQNELIKWRKTILKYIGIFYLSINLVLLSAFIIPLRFKMPLFKEVYNIATKNPNAKFYYSETHPFILNQQIKPDIFFSFYMKKGLYLKDLSQMNNKNLSTYIIKNSISPEVYIFHNGLKFKKIYQNIPEIILKYVPASEIKNLDKFSIYEAI